MERTNIRYLKSLPEPVKLITVDVSFIGLGLVLPVIAGLLAPDGQVIALIKPQFEVGKGSVGKGGVVRESSLHRSATEKVLTEAAGVGLAPAGLIRSPITGPAGNVEFLVWLRLRGQKPDEETIKSGWTCAFPHNAREDEISMFHLSSARRNRLLLTVALAVLVLVVLWVARTALVPYIAALALAYLMLPLVNRLDVLLRRFLRGRSSRASRPLAIILIDLLTAGVVVLFFSLVVPVIIQQFEVLWSSRDQLVGQGQVLLENIIVWYQRNVPTQAQDQLSSLAQQTGGTVARGLQTGITRTLSFVTNTFGVVLGLIIIPFFLFYVLYDQAKGMRWFLSVVPPRLRIDALNLMRVVDDILSAYIRGQLLLCVFIGVMATVGLTLLSVPFSAVLGLTAGIFEILPFIGPIIGAVPAVIVASIQAPLLGLWTLLLFIGIQQLENALLVPRISGRAVKLHPAVIMVVLVLGNQIAGFWGLVLAVPTTAIIRDVFKYLYLRSQDEPISPKEAMARIGRTAVQLEM